MWKLDFNMHLIGGGVHWDPSWPATGPDHEYYHQNLAQNLTINLLSGYVLATFYTDTIATACAKFEHALGTVPIDDTDPDNLNAFHTSQLQFFSSQLNTIARLPISTNKRMADLYLEDTSTGDLKAVVDHFEVLQQSVKWVCLPFLTLRQDIARGVPGISRPTPTDLDIHLHGNTNTSPLGGMDYAAFLFMNLGYAKNLAARQHAFRARWFDPLHATQRLRGDVPPGVLTSGKGNRLKCFVDSQGNKSCIPSTDPADFCAGGGTICAT